MMFEFLCPQCGNRFSHYDEHFEIMSTDGRVTGIACAKCGGKAEKLEPIYKPEVPAS